MYKKRNNTNDPLEPLANFLAEMIAKYANELDLDDETEEPISISDMECSRIDYSESESPVL